jgi:hypothetical protein
MNSLPKSWPVRAVWFALAVSAIWALFVFGSNYRSCRSSGSSQILCFILALFFSWLEVLVAAIGTVIRLIVLIMP